MNAPSLHAEPLKCQELVELVTSYLDGSLALPDRARFEAHLAGCGACTAYVEQMRQTIRLTGALTAESIPTEARTLLLETFRAWKRG